MRDIKTIGKTTITIPHPLSRNTSNYAKNKSRKFFRRHSAIEPVISHLKSDFRLARNYLKGSIGDSLNLLLAAVAFNLKKWMKTTGQGYIFALGWVFTVLNSFALTGERRACSS